jgi:hypothetical protein
MLFSKKVAYLVFRGEANSFLEDTLNLINELTCVPDNNHLNFLNAGVNSKEGANDEGA